jgi:hypothetical protein
MRWGPMAPSWHQECIQTDASASHPKGAGSNKGRGFESAARSEMLPGRLFAVGLPSEAR